MKIDKTIDYNSKADWLILYMFTTQMCPIFLKKNSPGQCIPRLKQSDLRSTIQYFSSHLIAGVSLIFWHLGDKAK